MFLLEAVTELPEALPRLFGWYLGHSIYEMVYRHERSGTIFGEMWINKWEDDVGTLFLFLILAAAVCATVNLYRKHSIGANILALLLAFAWVCFSVWLSAKSIMF